MVETASKSVVKIKENLTTLTVVNCRFIKPLDEKMLLI